MHFVDVAEFELAGYTTGLSAGLTNALADLDDSDVAAAVRGGYAAIPADRVDIEANVVEHGLSTQEGVAILDVRMPAGLVMLRHPGDRAEIVGLRLAAVRIGLARRAFDEALVRLNEAAPLLQRQLDLGLLADAVAALAALRRYLEFAAERPSLPAVVDIHEQLTQLDRRLAAVLRAESPSRALFVAELVANTWVGA